MIRARPVDALVRRLPCGYELCHDAQVSAETESGTPFQPVYGPEDLAGFDPDQALGEPGQLPLHAGHLPLDVHHAAVDHAPVRRLRHARLSPMLATAS